MSLSKDLSADQVVSLLNMQPHPEGGHYVETFRDSVTDGTGRAASTLIYFLLPEGVLSRWHKVDAVETWHWYAGAPLELSISADGSSKEVLTLGNDLAAGQRPQGIVPRDGWQQARVAGSGGGGLSVNMVVYLFLLIFVTLYTVVPSLLFIAFCEKRTIRSAASYMLFSAILAFAGLPVILMNIDWEIFKTAVISIPAGIISGLVYWYFAGRYAGDEARLLKAQIEAFD
eukprot:g2438.t1